MEYLLIFIVLSIVASLVVFPVISVISSKKVRRSSKIWLDHFSLIPLVVIL